MSPSLNKEQIHSAVILLRKNGETIESLRELCKTYGLEELYLLQKHYGSVANDPLGMVVWQQIAKLQHADLKKPHWTLVPTFWIVILGCAAGIISTLFEVLNREEPVKQSAAVVGLSKAPQK
jgi:hypothetical protein